MAKKADNAILAQLVERNLRWDELRDRIREVSKRVPLPADVGNEMGPYIAFSRQTGSGATDVAGLVGERLGWPVLDRELVEFMSERFHKDGNILRLLDDAQANWVADFFKVFIPGEVISQDTYVDFLGQVIKLAAFHGQVIFVGRGAQFFLPRAKGVAIRMVANLEDRVARIRQRQGLSEREALGYVQDVDAARGAFLRRYFKQEIGDPLNYDLVLNTSSLTIDQAAELVVSTCRLRGLA